MKAYAIKGPNGVLQSVGPTELAAWVNWGGRIPTDRDQKEYTCVPVEVTEAVPEHIPYRTDPRTEAATSTESAAATNGVTERQSESAQKAQSPVHPTAESPLREALAYPKTANEYAAALFAFEREKQKTLYGDDLEPEGGKS